MPAFGVSMVGYIGDFGDLRRSELLADAQLAFRTLCQSIGVFLKPEKADAGGQVIFLGLKGASPSLSNGRQILISLPRGKRKNGPTKSNLAQKMDLPNTIR